MKARGSASCSLSGCTPPRQPPGCRRDRERERPDGVILGVGDTALEQLDERRRVARLGDALVCARVLMHQRPERGRRSCAASEPLESSSISICVMPTWLSLLCRPRLPSAFAACTCALVVGAEQRHERRDRVGARSPPIWSSASDQSAPATSAFTSMRRVLDQVGELMPPLSTTHSWLAALPREISAMASAAAEHLGVVVRCRAATRRPDRPCARWRPGCRRCCARAARSASCVRLRRARRGEASPAAGRSRPPWRSRLRLRVVASHLGERATACTCTSTSRPQEREEGAMPPSSLISRWISALPRASFASAAAPASAPCQLQAA